jgi:hypothetical protein
MPPTIGSKWVRIAGDGPPVLKIVWTDEMGEQVVANSRLGGPLANSLFSAAELHDCYAEATGDAQ